MLDDTQRIYPDVANIKATSKLNSVLEGFRKRLLWNTCFVQIQCLLCRFQRHPLAPTVAQAVISTDFACCFNQADISLRRALFFQQI
jgi:hypothetical protein